MREPIIEAQVLQRQQRGRTHRLTGVQLRLWRLKELCVAVDPSRTKFRCILKHSAISGSFDDWCELDQVEIGNLYHLLSELAYLKTRSEATEQERDEILRWEWTCRQALKSDLPSFVLVNADPDRVC